VPSVAASDSLSTPERPSEASKDPISTPESPLEPFQCTVDVTAPLVNSKTWIPIKSRTEIERELKKAQQSSILKEKRRLKKLSDKSSITDKDLSVEIIDKNYKEVAKLHFHKKSKPYKIVLKFFLAF